MSVKLPLFSVSVAGAGVASYDVIRVTAVDTINLPYSFDIDFRLKKRRGAPPRDSVVGMPCHLKLLRGRYSGIVGEFRASDSDETDGAVYSVRLVPNMQRLALNFTTRVFRNMTVVDIIKSVVNNAKLLRHFDFRISANAVKYPEREYCVQYQESDLDFISRLMEEHGIWYYFEQAGSIERAVVTDRFSAFPSLGASIPFMKGGGFLETSKEFGDKLAGAGGKLSTAGTLTKGKKEEGGRAAVGKWLADAGNIAATAGETISAAASAVRSGKSKLLGGNIVESVSSLTTSRRLFSQNVRMRSYNYRTPENPPDGRGGGGFDGHVYEYGGSFKNAGEAAHRADLHAKRLRMESGSMTGKSNCAGFRAGVRVSIEHKTNPALSGNFLITSVRHHGGWEKGALTYTNEFTCVNADAKIYVPPRRTPVPNAGGLITAPVAATGESFPTLEDKYGSYNIKLSFVDDEAQRILKGGDPNDYGMSKQIRVAQPSSGFAGDNSPPYGFHFPAKQGAEMVLAYINGNPDKPVGLGFVPNAAAPSVVRCENVQQNIIRSWGGSEFIMDDIAEKENIKLITPAKRFLELHDGDKWIKIRSADCELLFNDNDKYAQIGAGSQRIRVNYGDGEGMISLNTVNDHVIEISDKDATISIKTAAGCQLLMDDTNDVITLQNAAAEEEKKINWMILNGKEKTITLKNGDNGVSLDGGAKTVTLVNGDNSVIMDGGENSLTLNAKGDINIRAEGTITFDAKKGIAAGGQSVKIN